MTQSGASRDRYFEDYVPGDIYEFGACRVDEAEVIEFASRYDPQAFHVDPEAAAQTQFGGLIASGWHTSAMAMRMLVDNYLSPVASIVSPGIDEIRWLAPVRPGDLLSMRVTVVEARESSSKPDRGVIRSSMEVLNQDGTVVMTLLALNLMKKRVAA